MSNEQKTINNKQIFQCPECGLHYRSQKIAKQCEEFCKTHNMCSTEIARFAIELELKATSDEG